MDNGNQSRKRRAFSEEEGNVSGREVRTKE
jgi:hypothetical protein